MFYDIENEPFSICTFVVVKRNTTVTDGNLKKLGKSITCISL